MRLSKSIFALTATLSLAFTGCQQVVKPAATTPTLSETPSDQNQAGTATAPSNQFNLQGKIGVKTPKQSGSAFFTWQQDHEDFDIQLSGILGIGKTIIEGKSGEVTLNSSKTGLIQAESPEELLERATGWVAPITDIVSWVQARPATTDAKIAKDDADRISKIEEDGWTVDLSYNDKETLPNKLILKQALESGAENRVTMVIQNR
ncbi:lipoprotein insertase outer membrane protein LolB [Acinetobacter gerneri]|uniref:Outer-membrane lipoprotein LolB n=2 Tax=Acinetobacter gerneri TaxID=202952 RepID=N8YAV1_9GAMM|nr:lipoprotein insertase outer membrane protein LolB [Acinetobacter gerneri]ENV33771.1 outer membrane lipoprotein LolB [Acinetobacter gerneri DSM 14967 = CIP 107464 = MTCC 9824]EPR85300.1 Outer membrane lipoprotein LolB precursor [Acinetobacter gerneri DSM 14967 = CIP 107464 = MTCC 9824]MDQ9008712.1 lipoprotein insertase outer membrane protein LolB [Acinetobacter gerneri]MDQ9012740.1 lipoprotein insertase outer membrane protein LolB [Acinetobacter gerneri]MDQ9024251.1 lipoprotein insertase out